MEIQNTDHHYLAAPYSLFLLFLLLYYHQYYYYYHYYDDDYTYLPTITSDRQRSPVLLSYTPTTPLLLQY